MKATIAKTTSQKIKVDKQGSLITTTTPITIKNQISEINSIEQIRDVVSVNRVDGATLVYDDETQTFQIQKLSPGDIDLDNLDGGTF